MIKIFKSFPLVLILSIGIFAQALGTAGSVSGVVTDPNGAVVAGASVTLSNALTGYTRNVPTGADGNYKFSDVPQNTYTLKVTAGGFGAFAQAANVRSAVPLTIPVSLILEGASATVDVAANATIVEN